MLLKLLLIVWQFQVFFGNLYASKTTKAASNIQVVRPSWVEEFCQECVTFGDACVFHAPSRRCFAFERHQPMTWQSANDWCLNENFTGLARLFTKDADFVIRQFLERRNWHYGNSFAYWIGGEYERRHESWQWSGLESLPMTYHNWEVRLPGFKAQPDNPSVDSCLDLELRYVEGKTLHYGWYDTRCNHMQFFICELVST